MLLLCLKRRELAIDESVSDGLLPVLYTVKFVLIRNNSVRGRSRHCLRKGLRAAPRASTQGLDPKPRIPSLNHVIDSLPAISFRSQA